MFRRLAYVVSFVALTFALASCESEGGTADGTCEGETGCDQPCELGNSFGVGQYCTPGGGECADTPGRAAPFCTGDYEPDEIWFCTRPCDPDGNVVDQCGEDAICRGEDGGGPTGCFPVICM